MTSAAPQKEMFERIESPQELKIIWTDLLTRSIEIQAKIGGSEKIVLQPVKIFSEQILCQPTTKQDLSEELKQEIIGQFSVGGDKYFFQSQWSFENNNIAISLRTALYKLQRRQNYRLKVPASFIATLKLLTIDGQATFEKVKIYDLSSGGCCLQVAADTKIATGQHIKGEITLGRRDELPVAGTVRHVRSEIQQAKKVMLAGIQFQMTPALESQLFSIMMELSRKYLKA